MISAHASTRAVERAPCEKRRLVHPVQTLSPLFLGFVIALSFLGITRAAHGQAIGFREINYSPLGDATLNLMGTPETGVLSIENIGIDGMDGAAAELPDVCFYAARWEALPNPGLGDLLRFRIRGFLGETPDQLLGVAQFERTGPDLSFAVDLIPGGVFLNQMRVVDGFSLEYSGVIADAGVLATVTTWPDEVWVESACSDAISSSLTFFWETPTTISIADGPTVGADAVSIGSSAFLSSFSRVELEAAQLSPLVLSDAQFAHKQTGTAVEGPRSSGLTLSATSPNPFNPRTKIQFSLRSPATVRLTIYDARGRLVNTLLHDKKDAGGHSVLWDGTDAGGANVGSGVYLVHLISGREIRSQKVTLVR